MLKKIFILLFIIGFVNFQSHAQNVVASAKLDSTSKILVGDQVKLKVQFTFPTSTKILWPDLKDTLTKHIEIINRSKIDTVKSDNKNLTLKQTITINSFEYGAFYIPKINFKYKKNKNDTAFTEVLTDSIFIYSNTIPVDTTKAIRDIKGPLSVPITFKEVLPYIVAIVIIAILVWLVLWIIRKRKKGESLFGRAKPKLPAHIEALAALEELRNKKLWQNNKTKEYYTELTDIIRIYIVGRYNILAMEMTTDEIMVAIFPFMIQETLRKKFKEMLTIADLVKFAKANPLPNEHDGCLDTAFEFVNATKPVEVVENNSGEKDHVE